MSRNVLMLYLSALSCRQTNEAPQPIEAINPFQYQVEGTTKTVKGRQTNEAAVRYLALDQEEKPDKIIVICSDLVRTAPCKVEGYATTLDYFKDSVLPAAGYAPSVLQVVPVPDSMDDIARNEVIQTVAQALDAQDTLYIDFSGGMRDISMLLVTLARYLQTILGITTRRVFYAELGKPAMLRDSTNLYDILDMISAVDLFFESGNVTKLRTYLSGQNAGQSANLLLQKIEAFSDNLALSQMSAIKGDLKAIASAIKQQDPAAKGDFHQLLFALFSQRFQQTFAPLIESRTESLPQLIEWCNDHMLYQQALTLISEQMPTFVCKHILAQPTDNGFKGLQSNGINNNQQWPYPLFHYHFRRLVGLQGGVFPNLNLCVNEAQAAQDDERRLYRLPTEAEFYGYLNRLDQLGELSFDKTSAAKKQLVQANDIYQRVLTYRNCTNHASKVDELLVSGGIPQMSAQTIRALLDEAVACTQTIQQYKRATPEGVKVRSETQELKAKKTK